MPAFGSRCPYNKVFEEHLVSSRSNLGCLPEKALVWTLRFFRHLRDEDVRLLFF